MALRDRPPRQARGNRDWTGCSYRGPILLHASSTLVLRPRKGEPVAFGDDVNAISAIMAPPFGEEGKLLAPFAVAGLDRRGRARWEPAPSLPFGGIVGRARVAGTVEHEPTRLPLGPELGDQAKWYAGGFALVLADVELLPFIPWRGSLGLFDVPDEVIASALRESAPRTVWPLPNAGDL